MNERIKELLCNAMTEVGPDDTDLKTLEKFAELIVRECSQIAMFQHQSHSFSSYEDLDDYERGQDDAASAISGQIKQHFGV